jgi:hypothetical protein
VTRRRASSYSHPQLARVALGAIWAREIQLVRAEVEGNALQVGVVLEEIAAWERRLDALDPRKAAQ